MDKHPIGHVKDVDGIRYTKVGNIKVYSVYRLDRLCDYCNMPTRSGRLFCRPCYDCSVINN